MRLSLSAAAEGAALALASLALLMARPEPSSEPERATARSMVTARAAPIMPMRFDTSCAQNRAGRM
jgi:hypothetical protein